MLFPIEVVPQPSRLMMAGLVVGHLVLGMAFVLSSLPEVGIGFALMGLVACAAASCWAWRRRVRLRFVLGQEGAIRVIPPLGPAYEARATRDCRDLGWAVWLAWRCTAEEAGRGQVGILMLPRDALAPEAWRALRVWLKFRSGLTTPD
jgi:membrane-bound toxin of toxin-antitoxin system